MTPQGRNLRIVILQVGLVVFLCAGASGAVDANQSAVRGQAAINGAAEATLASAPSDHDINCSCVLYVRSQTGLPGGPATAAGYTQQVMKTDGYTKVQPVAGAILVWDANRKGARADGHMAIIESTHHDSSTGAWTITVRHTNWPTNCHSPNNTVFHWPNLDGVSAYVRQLTLQAADQDGASSRRVVSGHEVTVLAAGTWCMGGSGADAECGSPDGIRPANSDESDVILPSAKLGQLIGKIGSGDWFALGTNTHFTATATGSLRVLFNDRACCYSDNSRSITVTVRAAS